MLTPWSSPCLFAATEVRHRIASRLVEGFDEWWQMPAAVLAAAVVVMGFESWTSLLEFNIRIFECSTKQSDA